MSTSKTSPPSYAACIGLDWADAVHALCLQAAGQPEPEVRTLAQTPEALEEWAQGLRQRFGGHPVAIALEQSKGALVYALLKYDFLVLYPVNPLAFAQYRKSHRPSGAKSDGADALLLLQFLQERQAQLRPLQPDTPEVRSLQLLTEARRQLVDQSTTFTNQLTSHLKASFPQVLAWFPKLDSVGACDFLERWPTLQRLQTARRATRLQFYQRHLRRRLPSAEDWHRQIEQAHPLTTDPAVLLCSALMVRALVGQLRPLLAAIDTFEQQIEAVYERHEDHSLFHSLPGAGPALGPRLLAALGSDRNRFHCAAELQSFSGIGPVTVASGKQRHVKRRSSCPKFVRQSFHEFAAQSIHFCDWAHAYYQQQRRRGSGYHAAIRALAFKWIRIIFRCWQNRTPYNESIYLQSLRIRGSKLITQAA
jgi:transposase